MGLKIFESKDSQSQAPVPIPYAYQDDEPS